VDYWIGYDSIEIFLELKHGWIATNSKSNSTRKLIQNLWDVMNTQLDHLEHESKVYQIQMGKSQTFFRIGMMILPFYQWSNNKEKIIKDKSHFQDIHKQLSKDILPIPSWTGLFWMHKSFQTNALISEEGTRFCYRPGFMVLLNVKEINRI
jgi:hypothetical protein